jgi:putative ABC transport system permease protein
MAFLFFLKLAFKRLTSRATLTVLLILSIALTLGLLVCIPVFSNAVGIRLMQEELSARVKVQKHSAFSVRIYALPTANSPINLQTALDRRTWLADLFRQYFPLPIKSSYMELEGGTFYLRPVPGDMNTRQAQTELGINHPVYVADIEFHLNVITGTQFGLTPPGAKPGDMPVWVERTYAQELDLQIGDRYDLGNADSHIKAPLQVVIAGIWEAKDRTDVFWYHDPVTDFNKRMLTTRAAFEKQISPLLRGGTTFDSWYFVFDESNINLDQAEVYSTTLQTVALEASNRLPSGKMDNAPLEELARGQQRKLSLELVLTGFAAPLFCTLIYFIVSMSALVARHQRHEVALLSSRGGGRAHILLLIALESLLILLVALPLGLAFGMGIARLMGYSSSFLQFVTENREPLPVYLSMVDWSIVGAGVIISLAARLWPTWQASRQSIVAYERRSARPVVETPLGMRLVLLVLLVAVTYYAYRQVTLKGTLGGISWQIDQPSNDPLLLAAPSLFLFTAPLALVELYELMMQLVSKFAGVLPSPAAYLSLLHLGREGGQYRAPTFLLILCLTLGIFFASVARSADSWLIERRRYEVGADLTFTPVQPPASSGGAVTQAYTTSDINELIPLEGYQQMPGVMNATLVGKIVAVSNQPNWAGLNLFAIDRLEFPKVANFRRYFTEHTLGEMMNRLGAQENGIILPRRMLDETGLQVGQHIPLSLIVAGADNSHFDFVVVDTYDYFPTVYKEKPAAIVNASYIDTQTGGGYRNDVWMKLQPGADVKAIIAQVEKHGLVASGARDLRAIITDDQQHLERVGIFGLLSVCFLASALLASAGVLVYSLLSVTARSQRFAALRAMGMQQRAVVRTVIIEYALTLGYGLLSGLGLGIAASTLYVPLFPLTDTNLIPVPPFVAQIDWQSAIWMAIVMAATLLMIIVAVLVKVSRDRIFEILRMGAWE